MRRSRSCACSRSPSGRGWRIGSVLQMNNHHNTGSPRTNWSGLPTEAPFGLPGDNTHLPALRLDLSSCFSPDTQPHLAIFGVCQGIFPALTNPKIVNTLKISGERRHRSQNVPPQTAIQLQLVPLTAKLVGGTSLTAHVPWNPNDTLPPGPIDALNEALENRR